MKFNFTEEQEAFREVLRRFLESKSPTATTRKIMETDLGYDADVWRQMCSELALTALHVPEEFGGAGFGVAELAIAAEEMGRALTPSPFFATTVLATTAILHAASDDQKRAMLPALAAGESIASLAAAEPRGGWEIEDIAMTAAKVGDVYLLSGAKSYVLDGMAADLFVVAARLPEGGLGLFAVPADADGLTRRALRSMDPTRRLARLDFGETPATLLGTGASDEAYETTLDVGLVCLANEMAGGAERLREDALEYVAMRIQFGRSIASFQVTKHKAADMLLDVELAKSAAYYAAAAFDEGDADRRAVASLAKAGAADAYMQTAVHAVQMHGGIGFTADNDTQLWFKRAKSSEVLLGDAHHHRERMLRHWSE